MINKNPALLSTAAIISTALIIVTAPLLAKATAFWVCLQVFIVIVETFIRLSVTSTKAKKRIRGYFCGVCAQFLWLAVFIHTQMWYLMPLLIIDGSIWLHGYLEHRKPHRRKKRISPELLQG